MTAPGPNEHHKRSIEHMQSLRGKVINGFAQLEFFLADLIDRANGCPEYQALQGQLPMGVANRAIRVRALLAQEGRLSPWRDQILAIIDFVLGLEEVRHYLSHGLCRFNWSNDGYEAMTFTRYAPPAKGTVATPTTLLVKRSELEALAEKVGAETTVFLRQFRFIHHELRWTQPGLEPQVIPLSQLYHL